MLVVRIALDGCRPGPGEKRMGHGAFESWRLAESALARDMSGAQGANKR